MQVEWKLPIELHSQPCGYIVVFFCHNATFPGDFFTSDRFPCHVCRHSRQMSGPVCGSRIETGEKGFTKQTEHARKKVPSIQWERGRRHMSVPHIGSCGLWSNIFFFCFWLFSRRASPFSGVFSLFKETVSIPMSNQVSLVPHLAFRHRPWVLG